MIFCACLLFVLYCNFIVYFHWGVNRKIQLLLQVILIRFVKMKMNELGLAIIGLRNLQTFNMCCICPLEVNIVSTVKKLLLHLVLSQTINCHTLQSNSTYMCGLYHNGSRSAIEMLLLQRFQVIESLVLIMIL